jgi:hypothetical protein
MEHARIVILSVGPLVACFESYRKYRSALTRFERELASHSNTLWRDPPSECDHGVFVDSRGIQPVNSTSDRLEAYPTKESQPWSVRLRSVGIGESVVDSCRIPVCVFVSGWTITQSCCREPRSHNHAVTTTQSQPRSHNHAVTTTQSQPRSHNHAVTTTQSQPRSHEHAVTADHTVTRNTKDETS